MANLTATKPQSIIGAELPHTGLQEETWAAIMSELRKKVPPQVYTVFFSQLNGVLYNDELILTHANPNLIDHLKKRYGKKIEDLAREKCFFGKIIFKANDSKPTINEEVKISTVTRKSESAYPNAIEINSRYLFDRFVKGPSNEHAFAAAMGAAKAPGSFHNPLYLYGGVGLGKTHLMMAIGNYVKMNAPWLKVRYTPSEIFQSDLIEAYQTKNLTSFKSKYRSIDILLIDDIQFISKNAEATQEEIFNTFNYLYQNKKQIVISADRPPQLLQSLHDRLQSRFQSGLIVDIKSPNFETRMAIIKAKGLESNMHLPDDVVKYLAGRFSSQVRTIESALSILHFTADHEKRPIDLQMAKISLSGLPKENGLTQVTVDDIIRVVSKYLHVDESLMKSGSRGAEVVLARHVAMYITKMLLRSMTLIHIAQAFGRNDHTTVLHAEKKIRTLIDRDQALKIQISEMLEELKQ